MQRSPTLGERLNDRPGGLTLHLRAPPGRPAEFGAAGVGLVAAWTPGVAEWLAIAAEGWPVAFDVAGLPQARAGWDPGWPNSDSLDGDTTRIESIAHCRT
jgi:hypothetical protein